MIREKRGAKDSLLARICTYEETEAYNQIQSEQRGRNDDFFSLLCGFFFSPFVV